jgi:hypothetical protein
LLPGHPRAAPRPLPLGNRNTRNTIEILVGFGLRDRNTTRNIPPMVRNSLHSLRFGRRMLRFLLRLDRHVSD